MLLRARPRDSISSRTRWCIDEAHALVEVALALGELDLAQDLGLGRQLGRHLLLGPAQHERAGSRAARSCWRSAVALLLDLVAEDAAEGLAVAEEARQQEVEDRPELAEVVLHRRAGQRQLVLGAGCWAAVRASLVVGFLIACASSRIAMLVAVREQQLAVAQQQRVARQHDVVLVDAVEQLAAVVAVQDAAPGGRARTGGPRCARSGSGWSGATTRQGRLSRPASFSARMWASAWSVLPRPMSSASTPERPHAAAGTAARPAPPPGSGAAWP